MTLIPNIALSNQKGLLENFATSFSGQGKAGNCEHKFASRLTYEEQLKILLKDFPGFIVSEPYEFEDRNCCAWVYQRIDFIEPETGEAIGNIQYRVYKEKRNLHIFDMRIERPFRNQGLSKLLFLAALSHADTVETVRTRLGIQNYEAFSSALSKGASLKEALKETPAYKIRALAGFPTILESDDILVGIDHDPETDSVGFSVSR